MNYDSNKWTGTAGITVGPVDLTALRAALLTVSGYLLVAGGIMWIAMGVADRV